MRERRKFPEPKLWSGMEIDFSEIGDKNIHYGTYMARLFNDEKRNTTQTKEKKKFLPKTTYASLSALDVPHSIMVSRFSFGTCINTGFNVFSLK